MASSSFSL